MRYRIRGRHALAVLAVAALALAASLTASAARHAKPTGKPIVVGYSIAKTGVFSPYDLSLENSGKIAMEEINAKGGVLGRPITLIDFDTKSDLNLSASGAKELLARGADVIIGTSDYDYGGPAARTASQAGHLALGLAGDPLYGYHGIGPLAFNLYQGSNAEGAVMAEFAYAKGWRKPFVLTDHINSYPPTVTAWFKKRWKELTGGNVAGEDIFQNSDPSIATQISHMKGANPDFVVVGSFPPGGATAIKQIRAAGVTVPILGDAAFDGSYWYSAIPNLSDFYLPVLANVDGKDPSPERTAFFKKYTKVTGKPPILGLYATGGYSQIQVLAEGIKRAGSTDGAKVAKAIEGLRDFPTLMGPTFYSRPMCNIPQNRPFLVYQVQKGVASFIEVHPPKHVPAYKC